MKKVNILLGLLVCITMSSICTSCVQPTETSTNEPVPPAVIHYDTLSLVKGGWKAEIVHISSSGGEVYAYMTIVGYNIDKQLDSVPYGTYNHIMMHAVTQDTLLPLGTYTAQSNETCCYLLNSSVAYGAETERWFKAQRRYEIKGASIHIDKDSAQNYYLDAFIQMKAGENLYIHCPDIWRMYNDERGLPISAYRYYPR